MIDKDRILKIKSCSEVAFTGRDQHGDFIAVRIDNPSSQDILDFLKRCIVADTPQLTRLAKDKK